MSTENLTTIFTDTVTKLHEIRARLVDQLAIIDNAIAAMGSSTLSPTQLQPRRRRKPMSAAARARISRRQKAIWRARRAAAKATVK